MTNDQFEAQIEAMARAIEPLAWRALGLADTVKFATQRENSLLRARAAAEAIGLKPGMVIVPEQPTEAMLDSACDVDMLSGCEGDPAANYPDWAGIYAAMIAASLPRQPEKEGATAPAPQAPRAR